MMVEALSDLSTYCFNDGNMARYDIQIQNVYDSEYKSLVQSCVLCSLMTSAKCLNVFKVYYFFQDVKLGIC